MHRITLCALQIKWVRARALGAKEKKKKEGERSKRKIARKYKEREEEGWKRENSLLSRHNRDFHFLISKVSVFDNSDTVRGGKRPRTNKPTHLSSCRRFRSVISRSNLNFDTSQSKESLSPTTSVSSRCSRSISAYWRLISWFFSSRILSTSGSRRPLAAVSPTLPSTALISICLLSPCGPRALSHARVCLSRVFTRKRRASFHRVGEDVRRCRRRHHRYRRRRRRRRASASHDCTNDARRFSRRATSSCSRHLRQHITTNDTIDDTHRTRETAPTRHTAIRQALTAHSPYCETNRLVYSPTLDRAEVQFRRSAVSRTRRAARAAIHMVSPVNMNTNNKDASRGSVDNWRIMILLCFFSYLFKYLSIRMNVLLLCI